VQVSLHFLRISIGSALLDKLQKVVEAVKSKDPDLHVSMQELAGRAGISRQALALIIKGWHDGNPAGTQNPGKVTEASLYNALQLILRERADKPAEEPSRATA
jgi:AraC-like DNA-binding protein